MNSAQQIADREESDGSMEKERDSADAAHLFLGKLPHLDGSPGGVSVDGRNCIGIEQLIVAINTNTAAGRESV
jgi:hypothetical protein